MTTEQEAHVQLWLEALRSGEFTQGTGFLHIDGTFCCLGVACEVARKNGVELDVVTIVSENLVSYDDNETELPYAVQEWLGLSDCVGSYDTGATLVKLNDEREFTFDQIADVIESRPAGLFT